MPRVALSTLALLLAAGSCSNQDQAQAPIIRPVRTLTVSSSATGRNRIFSGTAKAAAESRLSFKLSGTLEALRVNVGDRVKKGQLIAALDDKDAKLQLREARAALGQAVAQARNTKAEYARMQALYEDRNISLKDLDAARAGSDSGGANVAAARQRVELARSQLAYCKLTAPADGEIASVPVEMNENVNPGQTVAVLNSGAEAEVNIGVPGALIGKLSRGQTATVVFNALKGKSYTAQITELGVATEGATIFPVTLRLIERNPAVRVGMAAEVTIALGQDDKRKRTVVPAQAVLEDAEGRFVFVAKGKPGAVGTVERRNVEIGPLTAEGLEISKGLNQGDQLVVGGLRIVEPGMKVRLLAQAAASGSTR